MNIEYNIHYLVTESGAPCCSYTTAFDGGDMATEYARTPRTLTPVFSEYGMLKLLKAYDL